MRSRHLWANGQLFGIYLESLHQSQLKEFDQLFQELMEIK